MTATGAPSGKTWLYCFSRADDVEVETCHLSGDDDAEAHARELSKAQEVPIVVKRHDMVDWEYVTEVDERP
ncbi:MAG: hypothetical protein ACRDY2_13090 [Acidimicrobiales bacterium]